jgi:hypothetical protein
MPTRTFVGHSPLKQNCGHEGPAVKTHVRAPIDLEGYSSIEYVYSVFVDADRISITPPVARMVEQPTRT